ncbi:MAG: formate dehydrogenase subunit gamma [Gammaproteobacteria bacterium]
MTESGAIKSIIQEVIAKLKDKPGALLPILHGIQDSLGYIPAEAVPDIAKALNLSRAEVHGVISFYHYFRDTKPGNTTIHLCRAESCQAKGAKQLEKHVKERLGIDFHETTPDGAFTLEPVYCLGLCSCSPSMQVGDELYGQVTPELFDSVIQQAEETA